MESTKDHSAALPQLLTPTLVPLLTQLDIQTLALRTTQAELYTEIEHLSAELQLLHAATGPPIDPQTINQSQSRLVLLKKRMASALILPSTHLQSTSVLSQNSPPDPPPT
ncbi:hypothetical protein DFS34DRAFT_648442 [Phlyctochytrium arcticum]|nr:hypothetical protein DFS34DRAFT_648442 [Phlyctochytrium arcticum]